MHLRSLPSRSRLHSPASGTGTPAPIGPTARAERSFALIRWSVVVALILMIGGVSAATVVLVDRLERRAAHGIVEYARMQSRLVQAQWTDALARIDALQAIAARVSQAMAAGETVRSVREVEDLRSALTVAGPPISQVSGVDLDGRLSWSTLGLPDLPVSVADRDEVRAILDGGLDRSVGAPLVGRLSLRRTIRFGRAVRGEDGRLLGLTLVSVDTARIAHLGLGLEQPGHSFIALLRDDGLVLARSDGQDVGTTSLGMDTDPAQQDMAEDAAYRQVTGTDGVQRTVVSRAVPGSGTTVVVALDEEAMRDGVRATAAQMWRWSVLLDLALAVLAGLVLVLEAQFRRARTERVRHAALRAQEALIRAIADEANDMFAVLDSADRFVYVNPASQALLGAAPADLLGQVAGVCVAAEYRGEVREALLSLAEGGPPRRLVVPMLHRGTGEHRWMEVEASHITWQGTGTGREEGCFFIARDVTDRKRAEDALQQAREDLETVARAGPGTLYRMGLAPDGTRSLLYLANTGHLSLGFSHEEASTPGFFRALLHPEDRPRYEAGIASLRAEGQTTLEYRLQDREGTFRWVRDTCAVTEIRDRMLVVSGYLLDVDRERRQAEALEQARRLLSLGEIASGLAHELNQPLAAIGLSAENGRALLAREVPAVDAARDKFARIGTLATRASATIDSMRVFGREGVPHPVAVDLAEVVREAMGVMQLRFEREGIAPVLDIPFGLPPVRGIAVLLQQVVINLLANACDAYRTQAPSPGGPRPLDIRAGMEDGMVWLDVADQAGGIPPAVLPRLFEPFFTTKSHAGTGLGLAVSFGIIRQLGGSIAAQNADGGAVFRVTLPVHAAEPEVPAGDDAARTPA